MVSSRKEKNFDSLESASGKEKAGLDGGDRPMVRISALDYVATH